MGRQLKNALHQGKLLPGTDQLPLAPGTAKQTDGIDEDAFTGTGFPGNDVETFMKVHVQVIDDGKILNFDIIYQNRVRISNSIFFWNRNNRLWFFSMWLIEQ